MWYTKNLIKTAQQNLTINDVSTELRKYYPNLSGVVTGDNNNYSILLSDGKRLDGTLPELIAKAQNLKNEEGSEKRAKNYEMAINIFNSEINNFNKLNNKAFPNIKYDLNGLVKYVSGENQVSMSLQDARKAFDEFKTENTAVPTKPVNKPDQEAMLLSPVSNGSAQIQLPEELFNQYNEASNLGSNIKFNLTQNPDGTNNLTVKEVSQYYSQHPKLLEAIRLFLEKNGKFQFATDNKGDIIPGEYYLYQEGGVKPANYQPAKLNIFVPGAAERTPVDLFLDGQKIATVINNTDFTFDIAKYPLLEGKHVLEARAEKVPSLTPIQDKYLKTLSKNRSYYFNVEEGKMPNLTTPINDLSTYKAANPESYGSGTAVKLRENPYRSPQRDLLDNKIKSLQPAFKRYYIAKARISDNDPITRKQIIDRAIALQDGILSDNANNNKIFPNEYEDYVTAILSVEGPGQIASDTQLNAIINKIQVERPPAAPAG
jgi:hypothetical protein